MNSQRNIFSYKLPEINEKGKLRKKNKGNKNTSNRKNLVPVVVLRR